MRFQLTPLSGSGTAIMPAWTSARFISSFTASATATCSPSACPYRAISISSTAALP